MQSKKTHWCIPVSVSLDDLLEQAVAQDSYVTKSDFVRSAVRKQLEEMGFKPQPPTAKKD